MTETKNICEDFISQVFIGKWIDKLVHTVNGRQGKVIYLLPFSMGVILFEPDTLKRKKKKKNLEKVIDKDLLNIPQATDKAKSRAEIDALLACFN